MSKLTAVTVKSKKKPGRHADGKGLYLFVKPTGAKTWILRVQADGKRRDIGLGAVDTSNRGDGKNDDTLADTPLLHRRVLTLSEAREKAALLRAAAKSGLNPVEERDKERKSIPTFKAAAKAAHDALQSGWAGRGAQTFINSLTTHVFPTMGDKRVDAITAADITTALEQIWTTKPDMARKVRQRISTVLNFSHGKGWRPTEAPGKSVTVGLPRQPEGSHYLAMPYADVPEFIADMRRKTPTIGRQALELHVLTAARPGEVRKARWGQIDFARRDWNRPAEIMKGVRAPAHTVTLSAAAINLLERVKAGREVQPDDLIFPGQKGKLISDMTMNKVLRDAGIGLFAAVSGWPSSARASASSGVRLASTSACAARVSSPSRAEAALPAAALANTASRESRQTPATTGPPKGWDAGAEAAGAGDPPMVCANAGAPAITVERRTEATRIRENMDQAFLGVIGEAASSPAAASAAHAEAASRDDCVTEASAPECSA